MGSESHNGVSPGATEHRPSRLGVLALRHAATTNALNAGVPLRDAQILARHADPAPPSTTTTPAADLDRHGVHFLTAYVAGV